MAHLSKYLDYGFNSDYYIYIA